MRFLHTSLSNPDAVWVDELEALPGVELHSGHALYLSNDAGDSWAAPYPPALMDREGGLQTGNGSPETFQGVVYGILVDPRSTERMFAWGAAGEAGASDQWPVRYFITEDRGNGWVEIPAPPFSGNVRWLSNASTIIVDAGSTLYASDGSMIVRSKDWGETWIAAGPLPQASIDGVATLDTREAGHLFSWSRSRGLDDAAVWRSSDGASTWNELATPPEFELNPVLEPPGGAGVIVIGGRSGISIVDAAKAWKTLPIVPIASVAQSPVDLRIWANDIGVQSVDGGLTWTSMGEAPNALLLDGANADVAYSAMSYGSPGSRRTEDGGKTWTPSSVPPYGVSDAGATCWAPFSCLYALSYASAANRCVLARSNDHARTWLETTVPNELCTASPSIAVSPYDPEHLIASCGRGVCETWNRGASWRPQLVGSDPERIVGSVAFVRAGAALAVSDTSAPLGFVVQSVGGAWVEVSQETGYLVTSAAQPHAVFLMNPSSTNVSRSDDWGTTWKVVSPDRERLGGSDFRVWSIADAPDGAFIAATSYGLVKFE